MPVVVVPGGFVGTVPRRIALVGAAHSAVVLARGVVVGVAHSAVALAWGAVVGVAQSAVVLAWGAVIAWCTLAPTSGMAGCGLVGTVPRRIVLVGAAGRATGPALAVPPW
jgi:hypothetical protein